MNHESASANERLLEIRELWLATDEGQRLDVVDDPEVELQTYFDASLRDLHLRLKALANSPHPETEIREMEKEIQLCQKIGSFLF